MKIMLSNYFKKSIIIYYHIIVRLIGNTLNYLFCRIKLSIDWLSCFDADLESIIYSQWNKDFQDSLYYGFETF